MDPPIEEEREPLDCKLQPIPDSRKVEDFIGSGEFERSLEEDLWLAIMLAVVVTNEWLVAVYNGASICLP